MQVMPPCPVEQHPENPSSDPNGGPHAHALTEWPITAELVHGAVELEVTPHGLLPHRLPRWARTRSGQMPAGTDGTGPRGTGQEAGVDPQLAMAEAQPSGVRLVFHTTATIIELDTLRTRMGYLGAPPRPEGVYDLQVDDELVAAASSSGGNLLELDMSTGGTTVHPGDVGTVRFAGLAAGEKEIRIFLPHNEITELVALRTDAAVAPVDGATRFTWLHHGSSISHGSNATNPAGTWPAVAARLGGVELTNLGFGGSAMLDPFTARVIAEQPADLISLKIGINLVNADLMLMRGFTPAVHGFLDQVRQGHRDTPLVVITPIHCPIHENTPGPCAPDLENSDLAAGLVRFKSVGDPAGVARGKLTLATIRTELARIVAQRRTDDPNLHLLDGQQLYGPDDFAELPLPDALHPDGATHLRMGKRFSRIAAQQGFFAS